MKLRHQLAAYSPLSLSACARGGAAAVGLGSDPRERLRDLLFKDYQAQSVVLCGSGTQALQLAILSASRDVYGEAVRSPLIAMPAFSCFDLASAAIGADTRVSLYDLDPRTLAPEMSSLTRVIAAGAKVVVIAPLYGVAVNWEAIEAAADRYGAVVIEDAAQGHGASWRGRALGTLGRVSTLSFGRGKGWTGGGGGAVLFRRGSRANLSELPAPGVSHEVKTVVGLAAQWTLGRPGTYGIPRSIPSLHLGETTYHAPSDPVSISRTSAAAVLANRDRSDREGEHRRIFAASLVDGIEAGAKLEPIEILDGAVPGFLRLPLRRRGGASSVLGSAERAAGIERSYPAALSKLEQFASHLACTETSWPGAEQLVSELITYPTHSRVTLLELRPFLK
jgi:dTDP-4-amino-4,6-dideoxygalactose transaminase